MTAEAVASIAIAPILPFIAFRSRSTFDKLPKSLREIAARLRLDRDHDRKKVRFGDWHALGQTLDRLRQGKTHGLRFHDAAKFGFDGIVAFVRYNADGVAKRQSRSVRRAR